MPTLIFALLIACSGDSDKDTSPIGRETGETGAPDSGETGETGDSGDSAETGESGDSGDSGETGVPLDGFGALSGDCGVLDETELGSGDPWLFRSSIDFGEEAFDPELLSPGALEIYEEGTLGGSSGESEAIAFDVLYRCELAELLKSETEILYDDEGGKKTDILVLLDGQKLGVSVTRAYGYPPEDPYTVDDATTLLEKKLADILLSTENAADEDAWSRQILSIIAYAPEHADSVESAWAAMDPTVKADTIVYVTVTEGEDEFIY